MEVEITPTSHSVINGYDLTVRTHSHGWCKSDLTRDQLAEVRDKINAFLADAEDIETITAEIMSHMDCVFPSKFAVHVREIVAAKLAKPAVGFGACETEEYPRNAAEKEFEL